jgi:biopolymer transport protein ExbD
MTRRRNQRKGRRLGGAVPVDSFSDIAFLLIIYFILATTLVRTQGFASRMPGGRQNQQQTEEKNPTCTLRDRTILWKDEVVTLDQLRARLAGMDLPDKPEDQRVIILKTTGSVPYQTYYRVWAAITESGGIVSFMQEGDQ